MSLSNIMKKKGINPVKKITTFAVIVTVIFWAFTFASFYHTVLIFSLFIRRYEANISEFVNLMEKEKWISDPRRLIEYSLVRNPAAKGPAVIYCWWGIVCQRRGFAGNVQKSAGRFGYAGVSAGAGFGACAVFFFPQFGDDLFPGIFLWDICRAVKLLDREDIRLGTNSNSCSGRVLYRPSLRLISFVKYVADPLEKLPTITFWLMGA